MAQPTKPAPPPPYHNFDNSQAATSAMPAPVPFIVPVPMQAPAPTFINLNNPELSQPVGPKPVIMTCPQCRCRNKTVIKRRATLKTHLACCLLSWTLCLCCLPYRMNSCMGVDHSCPTCEAFLGSYSS